MKTKSCKIVKYRLQRKESQAEFRRYRGGDRKTYGKMGSSGTIYKLRVNYFTIKKILLLLLSRPLSSKQPHFKASLKVHKVFPSD